MRPVDNSDLERWRSLDAMAVLEAAATHVRVDRDYRPRGSNSTVRVHISADGRDFELLLTGVKWYDTRAKAGGGGAVDLAMHLFHSNFRQACQKLKECSL